MCTRVYASAYVCVRVDMFVRVRDREYAYVCVYELCVACMLRFLWNNFDVQNVCT